MGMHFGIVATAGTADDLLGALGLPTLFVQEGGYDLGVIGRNVVNVLTGFEEA